MNPIAEILLEQVIAAREKAQEILTLSGLKSEGVIYAFATSDTLVINCEDDETTWHFSCEQGKLLWGLARLKSSIQTILIEKKGKTFYYW